MNIQNCTPLQARQVFNWRPRKNMAVGGIVFAILFCASLALAFNLWIAAVIAVVPALCLYLFLESRVIFIECPTCRKSIDTNTPWECGFKKCRNENVGDFPFINECEDCHFVPKAYECHHCKAPIFLTIDRQKIHMAKCLGEPEPVKAETVVVVKDVIGDKVATQKEEIRDLRHRREKAAIEKEIETIEKTPAGSVATKTLKQIIHDEVDECVSRNMTLYEVEKQLKAEVDTKYPNDEHMRAQMYALIEREILKRMQ